MRIWTATVLEYSLVHRSSGSSSTTGVFDPEPVARSDGDISSQPPKSPYDEAASKKVYPGQHTFEEFVKHNEAFKKFLAGL